MKLIPLKRFAKQLTKKTPEKLVKYLNTASRLHGKNAKKYEDLILKEIESRKLKIDWNTEGFGRWTLAE